ncbi:MAG TPA: hypothetical protein VGO00_30605 [Kofleriaceae bacterium]|nr:hypothetical protein [Kofleriaceae bacterium]
MKLVIALALVCACGDDHSAIEHHHQPLPLSARATDAERAQLRGAIDVAMQRVKASKRLDPTPPPAPVACDPLSTGCRHYHVDFDKWDLGDGPGSAVEPFMGVRDQIDGCLGSAQLIGKLSIDVDAHGKVTDATVTGIGSHHGCVEDILRGLDFPVTSLAYTVSARLTYN